MKKEIPLVILIGLYIILIVGCQSSHYYEVTIIEPRDDFDICSTRDNTTIKCVDCYVDDYSFCKITTFTDLSDLLNPVIACKCIR